MIQVLFVSFSTLVIFVLYVASFNHRTEYYIAIGLVVYLFLNAAWRWGRQ